MPRRQGCQSSARTRVSEALRRLRAALAWFLRPTRPFFSLHTHTTEYDKLLHTSQQHERSTPESQNRNVRYRAAPVLPGRVASLPYEISSSLPCAHLYTHAAPHTRSTTTNRLRCPTPRRAFVQPLVFHGAFTLHPASSRPAYESTSVALVLTKRHPLMLESTLMPPSGRYVAVFTHLVAATSSQRERERERDSVCRSPSTHTTTRTHVKPNCPHAAASSERAAAGHRLPVGRGAGHHRQLVAACHADPLGGRR